MDKSTWVLDRKKLGISIRAKRGDSDLTQASKVIGISRGTMQRIEEEQNFNLGVDSLFAICYWLRIKPGYFILLNSEVVQREKKTAA